MTDNGNLAIDGNEKHPQIRLPSHVATVMLPPETTACYVDEVEEQRHLRGEVLIKSCLCVLKSMQGYVQDYCIGPHCLQMREFQQKIHCDCVGLVIWKCVLVSQFRVVLLT